MTCSTTSWSRIDSVRRPDQDELCELYPEFEEDIRELLPAILVVEGVNSPAAPTSTVDAKSLPQQIGDYRVNRELGRGGMGIVYEAEHTSLHRRVALKVLPQYAAGSASALERFQRETRAAARMHHSNIVPVFEVGQDGDTSFYAMQLIQGQSLDKVLDDLIP